MGNIAVNTKTELNTQKRLVKLKKALFIASILALPIALFLVFWIYVNADSFVMAFQRVTYKNGYKKEYFSLDNFKMVYEAVFKNHDLSTAFRNTCIFYAVALFVVFPLSILMAYFVYKKIFCYKYFRVVAYLPNIITSAALVVLYQYTFDYGGPYHSILNSLGLTYVDSPIVSGHSLLMLLIYNVIFGFGANMIVLGGAMNSISTEVLEAGELDGCNWIQELFFIILPMIWPTISTILILSMAGFMSSTGPILAMTPNNTETFTLSYVLYCRATGVGGLGQDIYYASAIGLVMSIITFPIVLILRRILNKIQAEG